MQHQDSGILVVINPVEPDDETLIQQAKHIAQQLDTHVELFSCTYNAHLLGERIYETRSARKAKAHHVSIEKKRLDGIAKTIINDGITTKTDVYWDMPEYEAIVRKVYRSKPLIVLRRSEYRRTIDRALMSNDDWNLIRQCPAPLLLLRGKHEAHKPGVVWAAVDPMHDHDKPAELDDLIIQQAKLLAKVYDADLHLVHTFDSTAAVAALAAGMAVAETIPSREIQEQTRKTHHERLMELAVKHNIPSEQVHNLPGIARLVLPALAIEKQPDVIVMGAVSRGFFKRLFIGSTAEKILDKLPGNLCIVKPPAFESGVAIDSPFEMQYRETIAKEQGAA